MTLPTTPREELDGLLSAAIRMASKLIQVHGSHVPFAMVITNAGEQINVLADDTEVRDPDTLASTVINTIREMCSRSEVRAVALARNISYRSAVDGGLTDAIEVDLGHIRGEAVTCMLPFARNASGDYVEGQLFAIDPRIIFFGDEST
jgi:hypothetical protein